MNEERAGESQAPRGAGRKVFLIVALLAVLGVAGPLLKSLPPRQPTYQGKPLSYWLERCVNAGPISATTMDPAELECREAMRHMGTNAIPILLRMLQARDSALKLKLLDWVDRWDSKYYAKFSSSMADEQHIRAELGFFCIADLATNSIPAVVAIYNDPALRASKDSADSILKAMYPAPGAVIPYWRAKKQAQWYFETGQFKARMGDPSNALRAFSDAIKLEPTNAPAHQKRAEARYELGDFAAALSDASRAVQLDGSNDEAFRTKGLCEFALKNFTNAEADFTKVINANTNDFNAYSARGLARANLHKLDDALDDLSLAASLLPREASFHRNCGAVEALQKEYEAALADISEAINLDGKDPVAYQLRGQVKLAVKDYPSAILDFDKAIELNPTNSAAYSSRGGTLVCMNEFERATTNLEKALALSPTNASAYLARGFLNLKRSGNEDEARADFERALELEPKAPEPHAVVGLVHFWSSQWAPALAHFRKAFELGSWRGPSEATCYIWLIRAQTGEEADATAELKDYLHSLKGTKTNDWEACIGRYLSGSLTESNFLALATTSAKRPSAVRGQVCESLYYAGMKHKIAGDKPGAVEFFQKCLETKNDNSFGYMGARAEMQSLSRN